MKHLFFAAAAEVLRAFSWTPFGYLATKLRDAANWCEARA